MPLPYIKYTIPIGIIQLIQVYDAISIKICPLPIFTYSIRVFVKPFIIFCQKITVQIFPFSCFNDEVMLKIIEYHHVNIVYCVDSFSSISI